MTEGDIQAVYGLGKLEFHDAMHDLIERVYLTLNPSPKGEGDSTDSPSLKEKGSGDEVKMGDIADSVK